MDEFEKKMILSKEEYLLLLEKFNANKKRSVQVNYYFDTDQLTFNQKNITCRMRLKSKTYEGIIKEHKLKADHSIETKIKNQNNLYDNDFVHMGLKLQGKLMTERHTIEFLNCEIAFDKNYYLGNIDYEMEIEYSPNNRTYAYQIIDEISNILAEHFPGLKRDLIIQRINNSESKSKRFFDKLSTTRKEVT